MVREDGDPSLTHFEVLATAELHGQPLCAVRAMPKTGRTHQVRVDLPAGPLISPPGSQIHPSGLPG